MSLEKIKKATQGFTGLRQLNVSTMANQMYATTSITTPTKKQRRKKSAGKARDIQHSKQVKSGLRKLKKPGTG